jgi:hypothetical protein
MTSTAIKEYDSVKVCHLDLLKTSYDEWKVDFYNLIGASTPSLYYLLSSSDGLLQNRPSTFVDADAPTEAEKEALRVYDTRQLQLFSRLMMCLPKQLMLVAQQGQPTWGPNGREALDRLDEYYHDHDPGYLADLSYTIHNMSFKDYENDAELFLYALNHKAGLLMDRSEYAIPIQTKITILIRALKLDSRFDAIVSKHAVDPYTGDSGYLKACQTAVTFARRLRSAHTLAQDSPPGRTEHTLNLTDGTKPTCSHCGKLGHRLETCWQKFPELKDKARKRGKGGGRGKATANALTFSQI